jgi:hypothetical protein
VHVLRILPLRIAALMSNCPTGSQVLHVLVHGVGIGVDGSVSVQLDGLRVLVAALHHDVEAVRRVASFLDHLVAHTLPRLYHVVDLQVARVDVLKVLLVLALLLLPVFVRPDLI